MVGVPTFVLTPGAFQTNHFPRAFFFFSFLYLWVAGGPSARKRDALDRMHSSVMKQLHRVFSSPPTNLNSGAIFSLEFFVIFSRTKVEDL